VWACERERKRVLKTMQILEARTVKAPNANRVPSVRMQHVINNGLNRSPEVSTSRRVPTTYEAIGTRPNMMKEPNVTNPVAKRVSNCVSQGTQRRRSRC
jgi:hypothetical protein